MLMIKVIMKEDMENYERIKEQSGIETSRIINSLHKVKKIISY